MLTNTRTELLRHSRISFHFLLQNIIEPKMDPMKINHLAVLAIRTYHKRSKKSLPRMVPLLLERNPHLALHLEVLA